MTPLGHNDKHQSFHSLQLWRLKQRVAPKTALQKPGTQEGAVVTVAPPVSVIIPVKTKRPRNQAFRRFYEIYSYHIVPFAFGRVN
jgi:hypothetical protein